MSARKASKKREPSALMSRTSETDSMSWMVKPALTAMNDCGITPMNVPMKNTWNGIEKIGEARFTNQFGNKGLILMNMK